MPDIKAIQSELRASKIDGWLLYDFHQHNAIAYRVLGFTPGMATRRWFYLIPARGDPRKLVHRIESGMLDSLPGEKFVYAGGDELKKGLKRLLGRSKALAMEYSPLNTIPYVSLVDAGTIELVRRHGIKVVSSAELVQRFEACWTNEQLLSHLQAARIIDLVRRVGPLPPCPRIPAARLLRAMHADKKARGGRLRFVLPRSIGRVEVVEQVPEDATARIWKMSPGREINTVPMGSDAIFFGAAHVPGIQSRQPTTDN